MRWNWRHPGGRLRPEQLGPKLLLAPAVFLLVVAVILVLRPRPSAVLPDPQPLHGSQPYATVLCKFAGPGQTDLTPWTVSYYDRLMLGGPHNLDSYWRQTSYGAIDLTGSKAYGWFQMTKPASAYNRPDLGHADLDALARDCTAAADPEVNFLSYVGINLVFSDCADRSRGGAMDLRLDGRTRNYRVTWLCPGYASSQQIMAHEMGHSFGLAHSEDNQGAEYGNTWDLMSNAAYCAASTAVGTLAQDPIAYDKDVLGWIPPAAKYIARRSNVATIQLDDLEQQRPSSPGYLIAELPLPGGRFYTVEARGRTGYDVALPAAGVLIHEIDPRRENKAQLVQAQPETGDGALLSKLGGWPVGSVFMDRKNNVGVSVDKAENGGFVVTLYTGALPWPLLSTPSLGANASSTAPLEWQPLPGAHQYEVQIWRMASEQFAAEWGASFVTSQTSLQAPLAPGEYRWQVRALPSGSWSPPEVVLADRGPAWGSAQQVAQLSGYLRVAPMVSARADGQVEIAWAQDAQHRSVSVTQAALQGNAWAIQNQFSMSSTSRHGLALSFTPGGDLKVTWPSAAVANAPSLSAGAVALDAGGRAHTIWTGTGSIGGIFSAVIDSQEPSAGPAAAQPQTVQPVPVDGAAPGGATYSPALAVSANGNAQAVWIDMRDGSAAVYGAEQRSDGSWGPSRRLSDADKTVYGRPSVAMDAEGHAYATWQNTLGCGGQASLAEVSFAERLAGREWQPSTSLAVVLDGQMIDPVVATNEAGEVYVAWGEIKDSNYRLYAAYRGVSGEWAPAHMIGQGTTDAGSLRLSLAISPGGDAYLTWAETQASQIAVRFAATR